MIASGLVTHGRSRGVSFNENSSIPELMSFSRFSRLFFLAVISLFCPGFALKMPGPSSTLFLHGKSNDGPSFRTKMAPFLDELSAVSPSWNGHFVTSPFRGEWWSLPPGIRSGQASEYPGFEESQNLVLKEIEERSPTTLLGQSQGAILLFAMIANGVLTTFEGDVILNGIQYPKPFEELIEGLASKGSKMFKGRVLLVVGDSDEISPPEGASRCAEKLKILCEDVQLCRHKGGHSVPIHDEGAKERMLQYCLNLNNNE